MSEAEEKTEKTAENPQVRDLTEEGASKDKSLRFTKRFHMTWTDDEGTKHEGDFVIKRPTLGDQARIGVLCAEYREDKPPSSIDRATFSLHEWVATCAVIVTHSPEWFDPVNMYDTLPVKKVYEVAFAWFATFRIKSVG